MNERLTLQDLIDLLAQQQDLTKKDAETFLRELVSLISSTIEKNDTIKIKDFGTFKLVKVNARKSVDVNTGVDIEIPAHYKLSFTPDKVIKDALNRPFAHFETILLEEGVTFDSIEKRETTKIADDDDDLDDEIEEVEAPIVVPPTKKADSTVAIVEEPAPVVKEVTEPIVEAKAKEEVQPIIPQPAVEPKVEQEAPKTEKPVVAKQPAEAPVVAATPKIEEQKEAKSTVAQEEVEPEKKNVARKTTYVDEYDDDEDMIDYGTPRRNYYVIGLIAAAVLAIALVFVKFYPDIKAAFFENEGHFSSTSPKNQGEFNPSDSATMMGDVVEPTTTTTPATVPTTDEPASKGEALGNTAEPTKPASSDKKYLADITLERGQNLRQVASEYYKNKVFWVYIFEANKDIVKNPNNINAGMKLRIPALSNFDIDPANAEDVKKARKKESQLFAEFP